MVGLGGLGNFVGLGLTLMGVREILAIDKDVVELHNLNRQFLYREKDVGRSKAKVFCERIKEINPDVNVKCISSDYKKVIGDYLDKYKFVFDCLDSFEEKLKLEELVTENNILIHGSVGFRKGFAYAFLKNRTPRIDEFVFGSEDEKEVLVSDVMMISGIMLNIFVDILQNKYDFRNIYFYNGKVRIFKAK